jgi:hypothetical protein
MKVEESLLSLNSCFAPQQNLTMETQRNSRSDVSAGTRGSLDSIGFEQPSLHLIVPCDENPEGNFHVANAITASEHSSSDVSTKNQRDVDDVANPNIGADAARIAKPYPPPTQSPAENRSVLLGWWVKGISKTINIGIP